jgi:hypothetical protein
MITTHPILFSSGMVKAILEHRKAQTRRMIRLPRWSTGNWDDFEIDDHGMPMIIAKNTGRLAGIQCPYGKIGDELWVRETGMIAVDKSAFMYKDSGGKLSPDAPFGSEGWAREWKVCPNIHMPRWACRIRLKVLFIRIERLRDITEMDAALEGFAPMHLIYAHGPSHRDTFAHYWDLINAGRGCEWENNPLVWVIGFKLQPASILDLK